MTKLETSLHLYQPPRYCCREGKWKDTFLDAVSTNKGPFTWDPAAVLSILGFSYTCRDRTLVNEVKRQPWLSQIGPDDTPQLEEIPPHGRKYENPETIAQELYRRLCAEAQRACKGRKEIYILTSGGLDSRVVSGILAHLYQQGKLEARPTAVTWGVEHCRDVVYGSKVAEILDFHWIYVPMSEDDLIDNIENNSLLIGGLVPPVHLHCMHWFKNVSRDALVLAGSYGDMVGRAEFSGKHLLEYNYLRPVNSFGLMRRDVLNEAHSALRQDLTSLHERKPDQPKYVYCEYERHGHYTRNMLGQTMSIIRNYCTLYQMFTDPGVYTYMWSLHPAYRTDAIYAALLEKLHPDLARLPWDRTNRPLKGKTIYVRHDVQQKFHNYESWIEGPLYENFRHYIDPEWYAATGLFSEENVSFLSELVKEGNGGMGLYGFRPYELWVWLASFRRLAEHMENQGARVEVDERQRKDAEGTTPPIYDIQRHPTRRMLARFPSVYRRVKSYYQPIRQIRNKIRKHRLRAQALRVYPPVKE